jgi:hypothetical protein
LAALSPPVFAASPEELVGAEWVAELLRGEPIIATQHQDPRFNLIPRDGFIEKLLREAAEVLEPSFLVESLFLYPKPPGAAAGSWSDAERTALYNGSLALSTLAGIQYFSTSRNTMRTFYETSAVIDGPRGKPLADPVFTRPPAELTLYARQKDLTFGENIYQYTYYAQPGALICILENTTTMAAGIIPAVGKNKLRSVIALFDAGEYLLIYCASMAKAASLPGMNQRVSASFSTRVEAILKWICGRADAAFENTTSPGEALP